MKILLVRVGADQSAGAWNGPVDLDTREFAYVPIPESHDVARGLEKRYDSVQMEADLRRFSMSLPKHLHGKNMHLDPDFNHCTYGDQGQRAVQIGRVTAGDMLMFYAGLRACGTGGLVYALIGQITVERLVSAGNITDRDANAHTRREPVCPTDLVVFGAPCGSGRYDRCIPIGEYRNKSYRVRRDLLETWGDLTVKDGFIQRSARLPEFKNPKLFLAWLQAQKPELLKQNGMRSDA